MASLSNSGLAAVPTRRARIRSCGPPPSCRRFPASLHRRRPASSSSVSWARPFSRRGLARMTAPRRGPHRSGVAPCCECTLPPSRTRPPNEGGRPRVDRPGARTRRSLSWCASEATRRGAGTTIGATVLVPFAEQDRRDEKVREAEEEIDAESGSYRADAMAHKHQQNRDAAKPIQCWRVSKLARLLTYGFRLAKVAAARAQQSG